MNSLSIAECVSRNKLFELLDSVRSLHVGVVGDLGLDFYWYIDSTRSVLSRETPRFVRPVYEERWSLGTGAYIGSILKFISTASVKLFSIIGRDWRGSIMKDELRSLNIDISNVICTSKRNTVAYIRPILMGYATRQEDSRIDFKNINTSIRKEEEVLFHSVCKALDDLDVVIIADYENPGGIVSEYMRTRLNELALNNPNKVFIVDSRENIHLFRGMLIKPNHIEALRAVGEEVCADTSIDESEITNVASRLNSVTKQTVFITLGDQGALVYNGSDISHILGATCSENADSIGAGDVFIAIVGSMIAGGATYSEACAIANLAASVAINKNDLARIVLPEEIIFGYDVMTESE